MSLPDSTSQRLRQLAEKQIREHPMQLAAVIDYLLVESYPNDDRIPAGRDAPVELPEGVRIERLDQQLVNRLFQAASSRGENWSPTRQYGAVQAYVRDVWSQGDDHDFNLYTWDHDQRIWPTVQLSRLIRDNATSTEHAVRRLVHLGVSERLVPGGGYESHTVYRLHPDRPGWLDVQEAEDLKRLMEAWWREPTLPSRTGRALWRVESITSRKYVEDALPEVVGGFESLLKIGRDHLTAQFVQRVPRLAADVGVEISEADCLKAYDHRSGLVHGADVDLSVAHELDEFGRLFKTLQEALRRVVRRAIEDREFARVFEDDSNITACWPAVVQVRKKVDVTI